jgi:hypothetical protein
MNRDKFESNVTIEHLFSDKVIINFNVFGPSMINRIRGQGKCTYIIAPNCRYGEERNPNFSKQHLNPKDFSSSDAKEAIFSFSAATRYNCCFLALQEIKLLPRKIAKPEVDRWSSGLPTQSLSH